MTIPLRVLYKPIQKELWLSLWTRTLLSMKSCSEGSSMLARVAPSQTEVDRIMLCVCVCVCGEGGCSTHPILHRQLKLWAIQLLK